MLDSERIRLRAIIKEDLPTLREWYNDYRNRGIYSGGYNPMSTERFESERYVHFPHDRKQVLAIIKKETGRLIGTVSYELEEF